MHKSVNYLFDSCVKALRFFTSKILQQNLWGNFAGFCARFTNVFQSFYTPVFGRNNLLETGFTRFTQELLLELRINKLVKGQ